jgi:phosphoribosylamine--glycine ligase
MWCAPGNAGTAGETLLSNGRRVENVLLGAEDLPALLQFAKSNHTDLTVVGPDNPLALGIVDLFQSHGLRIWGPNQRAAQFEASKVFSQAFMEKYNIPTARSCAFTNSVPAKQFAETLAGRCAVKADGLALGKGVLLCRSMQEANQAIDDMLERRIFGDASHQIVIQEYLEGTEVSLHALCDGRHGLLFPTAQDHKRASDGDLGLNTGGMGTYCPTPFLDDRGLEQVRRIILEPWLAGCAAEGIDYRGILYPGLMLTTEGPKVLEFNARFGDPETQVYLALLENDLVDLMNACVDGTLSREKLHWKPGAAVCVVMASGGYPGSYFKGHVINGLKNLAAKSNIKVFHAGTQVVDDKTVTSGGRVLGVTAWSDNLDAARQAAYEAVEQISFAGAHFRRDIGYKALIKSAPR